MNILVIFTVACLVTGLAVTAVLVWLGMNAMLHGRGLGREAAFTIANARRALRSIYGGAVRDALPDDIADLLRKLSRPGRRETAAGGPRRVVFN